MLRLMEQNRDSVNKPKYWSQPIFVRGVKTYIEERSDLSVKDAKKTGYLLQKMEMWLQHFTLSKVSSRWIKHLQKTLKTEEYTSRIWYRT